MTVSAPTQPREKSTPSTTVAAPHGVASVHLDALRGLAAFCVVICHWRDCFFADYPSIDHPSLWTTAGYHLAAIGHQWVVVFFVLSGFLVGGSVIRAHRAGRWSWRSYFLARGCRLYVVLLPALVLGALADWTGMHLPGSWIIYSGHSGLQTEAVNVFTRLTPTVFLGNSLFLEMIWVPTLGTNGPLWSLVCEFWYYIAFPVLVLLLSKRTQTRIRIGSAIFLLLWCWFVGRLVVILAIPWLMGVLIVYLPPFPAQRPWTRRLAIAFALLLCAVGMVVAQGSLAAGEMTFVPRLHFVLGRSWEVPIYDLMLGPVVTFLIWVLLHCARSPMPSAYNWLAQRAARSSYTQYLVHLPALVLLKAYWHLPRAVPSWHTLLINLGPLLVVLLYAQIVYEFFEKNTDGVRNWLKPYVMGRKPRPGPERPEKIAVAT